MKVPNPARRDEDVKATKACWERTGVRCVYPALLRLMLAPIVAVSTSAWCAGCTYRIPVLGAGIEATDLRVSECFKINNLKICSMKVLTKGARDRALRKRTHPCPNRFARFRPAVLREMKIDRHRNCKMHGLSLTWR